MHEQVTALRLSTLISPDNESVQPIVHCPRRAESMVALECVGCKHLRSLEWDSSQGSITCVVDREPLSRVAVDRRADFAEAGVRAPLHEMLPQTTTCVTADVPIEQVKRLMAERGLRAVAVVDAHGKLKGIVSRTDLTTAATFGVVRDIMTANVATLPEDAPVAYAIALMAFDDVGEIPVVTSEGKVVGIYHALDALRWVAGRMGWVERTTSNAGSP